MTIRDMPKKFKNIILTGMPGSGKTTFGKLYAIYTGRYFLDFDKYFEFITKKKIKDVFENEGEEAFRATEEIILRKLEKKHNYVIAMGGGTLCVDSNFEFARRLGLIIFLETPLEVLAKRILSQKIHKQVLRPMFENLETYEDILEKLKILWQDRQTFYEKAYIHLNTEFSSLDNLKLQLGLYEKKSVERDTHKEKHGNKFRGKNSQASHHLN
jgi:shikimate kinase